ncbi:MAG: recombinase RecQ, partial [Streptosporangiaceae bacterium]
ADIWAYFGSLAFPPEPVVRGTLAALADAGRPLSTAALEPRVDLSRSRLEMMLKVLDVDGAVRRVRGEGEVGGGWEVTGQPWAYDADRYARVSAERVREQQAMLGYLATGGCRMEYLRRELDDPAAAPCGRCDNCTGTYWPDEVSTAGAAAARERLLRPGVEVAPRKMWPTGMASLGVDVSGKIPAGLAAEPGRALARLTDLGWGPRLRALVTGDAPDAEVPGELIGAVVKVLASWDWAQRPAGVVTVPSVTRPRLVDSLGRQIAGIGRLADLGQLGYTGGRPPAQYNSAQRLRALWPAFTVPDQVREAVASLDGPVLLVDDRVDSGWTMTVAAKLLREAGARAVLPFALAAST